jgi:hypothetical protein
MPRNKKVTTYVLPTQNGAKNPYDKPATKKSPSSELKSETVVGITDDQIKLLAAAIAVHGIVIARAISAQRFPATVDVASEIKSLKNQL